MVSLRIIAGLTHQLDLEVAGRGGGRNIYDYDLAAEQNEGNCRQVNTCCWAVNMSK